MPLLEVRNLSVAYDGAPALTGVSLEVEEGEIVSLVGANGAGKTTLLAAIAGLKPASAGSVLFEGRDVIGLPAHRLVQLGIGLVPEGRRLFPRQAVWRNLMLGAYRQRDRDWRQLQIDSVFQMFPVLRERRDQAAGTLSGGEQQMLAIGRALMSKPRLLLLDEPSLGIAPLLVDRIFNSLREINQRGLTLLLVEQRLKQALALAARAYVLQTGRIVLSGPSAEMAESEEVRRAYLGL
ncbi:MAG: ABC transporter ATP-binding protein [Candidatus Dormibacteraeota bacterium]|uniref:ABC transporter ATP-binding protein n=1 Tax=Candidatus Dormiibacter inghamiae TaxID=3127013 RepID=A0A934KH74_9BACT|nr:ABC transporter ATP-binding protein [Candidatus Dormibacteraeota bacterium]MBJ7605230.1 ABC transporter ATP-binding protein [Candidatus Dormibacteraeota bacterium]